MYELPWDSVGKTHAEDAQAVFFFFAQPLLFEPGYTDNELGEMDVLHQNAYWPQTIKWYFECPLVMTVFTI